MKPNAERDVSLNQPDIDSENGSSRRTFIKGLAYTAPVILTLTAKPAKAGIGSRVAIDADK